MNDKDMLHDLLASEKMGLSGYSAGIMESSCMNLRNTLMDNYKKCQDMQYKVFDTMSQRGWYQTKDAASNEVQQLKDQANQMMGDLK